MNIQNRLIHNSLLIILFLAAFLERTVFDLGPNVELVTTSMILASYYLGRKQAFWLVFLIMVATDRIIGNTFIFLFTWTGFLIPALFATPTLKKLITYNKQLITKKIFATLPLTGVGLAANIFFYLWTNFGVWLLDSWGMYSKDFSGLTLCYLNGLPFLKNQFISTLIFIPLGFIAIELAKHLNTKVRPTSKLAKEVLI